MDISTLQPNSLWTHFSNICKIPHASSNEQGVAKYIIEFAKKK